ncbi:MAG: DUF5691 domain-containing protein [Phormidesmis sp.]
MSEIVNEFQTTEHWQTCLSAALIGTDRRSPSAPIGNDAFAQMLQSWDWEQPASALLSAASAIAQYQAVGKTVSRSHEVLPSDNLLESTAVEPCEPDTIPCCSDHIAKYLGVTLLDYTEAASELLELIATADQRVPPKWLPTLLAFGKKRTYLQPLIVSVLGNRGRWLAAQNPNWRYGCTLTLASSIESEEDTREIETELLALRRQWDTGSRSERILAFKQWRSVDPASAREALSASWKREGWRDREAFITAMTEQLSIADEPFLEAALADRANAVRTYAAELLATLPNSKLCQRMTEKVQPFIQIRGKGQQLQITVSLPEEYNAAWTKDGIERKPKNGEGERAGWLRQMIATVPLTIWDANPKDLAQAAATHEWREALVNGWANAIQRQRSQPEGSDWAAAWLTQFGAYGLDESVLKDLLLLLPAQQREVYLRSQLPKTANDQNLAHWLRLIAQADQRWDFDFSRLVMAQLIKLLRGKPKYGDLFSPPITLALSLHPGVAAEASMKVEKLLQTQYPTRAWQKFLDRFLGLLNLRWEIYQAFANSS